MRTGGTSVIWQSRFPRAGDPAAVADLASAPLKPDQALALFAGMICLRTFPTIPRTWPRTSVQFTRGANVSYICAALGKGP